jgi:hypothetical protein
MARVYPGLGGCVAFAIRTKSPDFYGSRHIPDISISGNFFSLAQPWQGT